MLLFFVGKAGRASTGSGWTSNGVFFDWTVQPTRDAKELRCTLHSAKPLRGRVVAGAQPLAGATIRSRLTIPIADGNSQLCTTLLLSWRTTSGGDGRFSIDDAPLATQQASFAVEIAPETLVAEALLRQVPPRAVVLHGTATRPVGDCTIDVAACQPLSLRVFTEAKGPPKNAEVLFLTHTGKRIIDGFTPRGVPDSAGRLHVLLQPGQWTVFVRDETSMASAEVDATKPATLTLQLEPMPAMRALVVDERGEPVPGMRPWLQGFRPSVDDDTPLTALANAMNQHWIARTATDARGAVDVRFLPGKTSSFEVRFWGADKKSDRFVLEPNTERATIAVR
jgi:hypothetical protein